MTDKIPKERAKTPDELRNDHFEHVRNDDRFLHGEDLRHGSKWVEVTLTIKSVGKRESIMDYKGKPIDGWPIVFEERPNKMWMVTRTERKKLGINAKAVRDTLDSSNTKDWIGKKITLFPFCLERCFNRKNYPVIRVRIPENAVSVGSEEKGRDLTR